MIRNAAHDSVCACSVDDVVDAVLIRYAEGRQIGEGLADQALSALSRSLAEAGPVVVNPSARPRGGVVEMVVAGDDLPPDTQALPEEPGAFGIPRGLGPLTLDANTVRTILGMLPAGSQIDAHTWIQGVQVEEDESGIDITISFGSEERFDVPIASIKQDLYTRLGPGPTPWCGSGSTNRPSGRCWPGFPTSPASAGPGARPRPWPIPSPSPTAPGAGTTTGPVISNGLVSVAIDPTTGTFALDGMAGFGKLVDGGDHGDSYNYSPPHRDDAGGHADSVTVTVADRGPVKASAVITAVYRWPEYVDGNSRARTGERTVEVSTTVELRAEEDIVRVVSRFVNPSRDHRLRVHFPLPEPADHSEAECAFAVVRRGLMAEGRPDEFGLPTFPSRRFVCAGGLTVAHEGLLEYELVDIDESTGKARNLGPHAPPVDGDAVAPGDGLPAFAGRTPHCRWPGCSSRADPSRPVTP